MSNWYRLFVRALQFKKFAKSLPEDCRYAVINMDYWSYTGKVANANVFMLWSPEAASVKNKMVYSGTEAYIKHKFPMLQYAVQSCDRSENQFACVLDKLYRYSFYIDS